MKKFFAIIVCAFSFSACSSEPEHCQGGCDSSAPVVDAGPAVCDQMCEACFIDHCTTTCQHDSSGVCYESCRTGQIPEECF